MNPVQLENLKLFTKTKNDNEIVKSLSLLNTKKSLINDEHLVKKCLLDTYRARHGERATQQLVSGLENKDSQRKRKEANQKFQVTKLKRIFKSGKTTLTFNQLKELLASVHFEFKFSLTNEKTNINSHFFSYKKSSLFESNLHIEVKTDSLNSHIKRVIKVPTGGFYNV